MSQILNSLYFLALLFGVTGCLKIQDKDSSNGDHPTAPRQLQSGDLVVEGLIDNISGTPLDWTRFRRIFFREGSVVITRGAPLIIRAEQVYFSNSIIRTFPFGAKAEPGKNGAPGGSVDIQAGLVSGSLKLYMSGQQGGEGHAGLPFLEPAESGRDGLAEPIPNIRNFNVKKCRVLLAPTEGAQGRPGNPGGNGGDGGDSGEATIRYNDEINFQVQVFTSAGKPGPAGPGGPGQLGGRRGGWKGLECYEGQFKIMLREVAPSGPAGDPGKAGREGSKKQSCIFQDNRQLGCY